MKHCESLDLETRLFHVEQYPAPLPEGSLGRDAVPPGPPRPTGLAASASIRDRGRLRRRGSALERRPKPELASPLVRPAPVDGVRLGRLGHHQRPPAAEEPDRALGGDRRRAERPGDHEVERRPQRSGRGRASSARPHATSTRSPRPSALDRPLEELAAALLGVEQHPRRPPGTRRAARAREARRRDPRSRNAAGERRRSRGQVDRVLELTLDRARAEEPERRASSRTSAPSVDGPRPRSSRAAVGSGRAQHDPPAGLLALRLGRDAVDLRRGVVHDLAVAAPTSARAPAGGRSRAPSRRARG